MDAHSHARTPNRSPGSDGVLAAELAEFEARPETEHLKRLLADRDLVLELALTGYTGRGWQMFAKRLAKYGLGVLRTWIRNRKIFRQCAQKRIGLSTERNIPPDEAEELAIATVAEAINKFRDKVLVPGLWDYTKGATLRTYFIGQCVLQFPNIYRAWLHNTASPPPSFLEHVDEPAAAWDPTQLLDDRKKIASAEESIVQMAAGYCMGYTYQEIADRLNTTCRSVESKLWRVKKGSVPKAGGKEKSPS